MDELAFLRVCPGQIVTLEVLCRGVGGGGGRVGETESWASTAHLVHAYRMHNNRLLCADIVLIVVPTFTVQSTILTTISVFISAQRRLDITHLCVISSRDLGMCILCSYAFKNAIIANLAVIANVETETEVDSERNQLHSTNAFSDQCYHTDKLSLLDLR